MEDQDKNFNSSENDSSEENQLVSLNFEESRVLGSLIEKELTTPEYYPLTLNSLVSAVQMVMHGPKKAKISS